MSSRVTSHHNCKKPSLAAQDRSWGVSSLFISSIHLKQFSKLRHPELAERLTPAIKSLKEWSWVRSWDKEREAERQKQSDQTSKRASRISSFTLNSSSVKSRLWTVTFDGTGNWLSTSSSLGPTGRPSAFFFWRTSFVWRGWRLCDTWL